MLKIQKSKLTLSKVETSHYPGEIGVCVEARIRFMTFFCFGALTVLLPTYCLKQSRTKKEGKESLLRKRKVLHLLSQWITLGRDTLQDGEHTKVFLKMLYRCVLDDLCEFPTLEKEVKELQKLFRMQRRQ
ncbi:rap guanine nucleotide exchange factor 5b isoform X1 [Tachysurus ichikawai]